MPALSYWDVPIRHDKEWPKHNTLRYRVGPAQYNKTKVAPIQHDSTIISFDPNLSVITSELIN